MLEKNGRRATGWACLLLIAQPLFFYRHVLFHPRTRIPYDLAGYHFPLAAYIARSVREGVFPFWDPYPYCGAPIHADLTAQLFYPLTWISIALGNLSAGRNLFYWIEWLVPFHMILAGLFTFYLLRSMGAGIPAALLGGTAYQLGGFFASQAQHLGAICTGAWLPAVLTCVWELRRRTAARWIGLLAIAISLTVLSGFTATAAVVFGSAGLLAAALNLRHRLDWKFWAALAAGVGVGLGIAAVQLIPTYQLTGLSVASDRAVADSTGGGLPLESLASLIAPNYYHIFTPFDASLYRVPANFTFLYVYCGIIPLALLVTAPFVRDARALLGLTVVSAFWMLGESTPVYRLIFTHLPRLVRGSLYAEFALLAFSMFAALTAALALQRVGGRVPEWILWGAALVTAADLTHFGANRPMNSAPGSYRDVSNEYALAGASGALEHVHELLDGAFPPMRIDYLGRDVFFAATAAALLKLPTPDGDNPFALKRVIAVRRLFSGGNWWDRQLPVNRAASPLLSMLNVGLLAAPVTLSGPEPQLPKAGEFAGARLYQNPGVLPRFFLVRRVHLSGGAGETLRDLSRPEFAPADEAVVEAPAAEFPIHEPLGGGSVRVESYSANRVELVVTTNGRAFLASSEAMYPGWTATVNGQRARLYMTNGAFRGLGLYAGTNRVVMTYWPEHFSAAAAISMLCFALALGGVTGVGARSGGQN